MPQKRLDCALGVHTLLVVRYFVQVSAPRQYDWRWFIFFEGQGATTAEVDSLTMQYARLQISDAALRKDDFLLCSGPDYFASRSTANKASDAFS